MNEKIEISQDDLDDMRHVEPLEALPKPLLSGTFAIYEDGHGGYVLVTETEHGIQRKHIPAAIVKLATGGGVLGKKFGSLFG